MKVVFAGTPQFAATALQAIIGAGHRVELVLTQPDRPGGRGLLLRPPPVKELARAQGIDVLQPATLRDDAVQARLREVGAEAMVVAAYGLILPRAILALPRHGCLNIHASLLPRWRGAAPIQRAILAGDAQTGVSIMQMDEGLDTGPVLLSEALPIAADDTGGTLGDKVAALGARLINEALARLPMAASPQSALGVSYANKIGKGEAALDWRLPAEQLVRQVRAFDPAPGAVCEIAGRAVKVWRAVAVADAGPPGMVLAADRGGIRIACGEGAMLVLELQQAGSRRLHAEQFLSGARIAAGLRCSLAER